MKAAWTRKAQQRLREIHDRIALDQPGNARQFIKRIVDKSDLMVLTPLAGRVIPRYQRQDLREVYEGEYRIIYRIRTNGIDVVTVRHMARLLPKHLRNL